MWYVYRASRYKVSCIGSTNTYWLSLQHRRCLHLKLPYLIRCIFSSTKILNSVTSASEIAKNEGFIRCEKLLLAIHKACTAQIYMCKQKALLSVECFVGGTNIGIEDFGYIFNFELTQQHLDLSTGWAVF